MFEIKIKSLELNCKNTKNNVHNGKKSFYYLIINLVT